MVGCASRWHRRRPDGTAARHRRPRAARPRRSPADLRVDVELSGDLDDLGPAVDAAVYRIAQESITNAVRHARHATRVSRCSVVGDGRSVRLTVTDDGDGRRCRGRDQGYGLLGMTERAQLLGGTFDAGPASRRRLACVAPSCRRRGRPHDHPRARRRRPGARPDRPGA